MKEGGKVNFVPSFFESTYTKKGTKRPPDGDADADGDATMNTNNNGGTSNTDGNG